MNHRDHEAGSVTDTKIEYVMSDDIFFKIGLSSVDMEFSLSDTTILNTPIAITGKSNMFIDTSHKILTNRMRLTTEYIHDTHTDSDIISAIRIDPVDVIHDDDGHACTCFSCVTFMKHSIDQDNYYKSIYNCA
jgi:hypothetical protein